MFLVQYWTLLISEKKSIQANNKKENPPNCRRKIRFYGKQIWQVFVKVDSPTDTGKKLLATPACGLEYCTIKLIYFGLYYSFTTAGRKSDTVFEFFCHILDACHTVFNHLVALKFFKGIVHRLTFLGKKNRTNLSLLLLVLHLFM